MTGFETVAYAVVGAIVYSLSFYLKKQDQEFSWFKFTATGITGLVIGLFAVMSGSGINEADVITQLGMFASATAIFESWIKIIWRKILGFGK